MKPDHPTQLGMWLNNNAFANKDFQIRKHFALNQVCKMICNYSLKLHAVHESAGLIVVALDPMEIEYLIDSSNLIENLIV